MAHHDRLGLKQELPNRRRLLLILLSFVVPLVVLCALRYIPWLWHPLYQVTDAGSVDYLVEDMDVPRADFERELAKAHAAGQELPKGFLVNTVYMPAPHRVMFDFYRAFKRAPRLAHA